MARKCKFESIEFESDSLDITTFAWMWLFAIYHPEGTFGMFIKYFKPTSIFKKGISYEYGIR